jgi:hypothetical protein
MNRLIVAAAIAFASAIPAQKPSPKPAPVPVRGQGCVANGVEAGCLVVRDQGSGTLYNLLISGARPKVGEGIEFTGSPHDGPTSCMQGTPIDVSSWSENDTVKCSSDATPAPGTSSGEAGARDACRFPGFPLRIP